MALRTVQLATEYVPVICGHRDGGCGIAFAMTRSFYDEVRNSGRTWYCPQGHPRAFTGESDATKLKAAEARELHLKDQLEATAREAEHVRVALIRDRHRFANGVCPCCNRYFDNVHRHMTTQHPDYDVTRVEQHAATAYTCSCGRTFASPHGLAIHQGKRRRDDWASAGRNQWHAGHLTVV